MPMTDFEREQQRQRGRKGGKTPKKPFRYSIHDIAAAAGKSSEACQKDRERGKFDPYSLTSLWKYLHNCSERGL